MTRYLRHLYDMLLATAIAVGLAWVLIEWACQP
jgi:hypothetical protein